MDGPDEKEVGFSDWCQEAEFGEQVAFEFPYRYPWGDGGGRGKQKIRCRLWLQKVELDPTRMLRHISLPFERRMHLFAVTLEKAVGQRVSAKAARMALAEAEETTRMYWALRSKEALLAGVVRAELLPLQQEIDRLLRLDKAPFQRQLQWLRADLDYKDWQLPDDSHRLAGRLASAARRTMKQTKDALAELAAGKDPFAERRGPMLKSYYSALDDSWQTYSLAVPRDYTGDKPYPLIVQLHGHGGNRPYQGHAARASAGVIVAAPQGRGSIDYMLAAEADVLQVVEQVRQDYRIDPDRIVLEGHSMGGTGSWNLGGKYPDIFSCIAPVAGNTNHAVFFNDRPVRWQPAESFGRLYDFLQAVNDPVSYAENLGNLPVFAVHGALDTVVRVEHARNMVERLRIAGYEPTYHEFADGRHWGFSGKLYSERWQWMLDQRRQTRPRRVRFRTARLRYPGAYWLRLEQFEQFGKFAEIEAEQVSAGEIRVRADNVAALALVAARLPVTPANPLKVTIGDAVAYEGPTPDILRLHRPEDGWRRTPAAPDGKRGGLEGPVADAFLSPFVLVYGTSSDEALWQRILRAEAEAFANNWERLYRCRPRLKADAEVTDADIAELNLILYGGPQRNTVAARLWQELPVKLLAKGVSLGDRYFAGDDLALRLCYPNPLNPKRYVVVAAAHQPLGLWQINNRFGSFTGWEPLDNWNWFDYAVIDRRSRSAETMVVSGFFGPDWQPDPRSQWVGDIERRQASPPRDYPKMMAVPPTGPVPKAMPLTDLLPTRVHQRQGTVKFNRSFLGNSLRVGEKAYASGLGVRAPSIVEFQLEGRFSRLTTAFGIDLEGKTQIHAERAKTERMQFLVYGDGRRLWSSDWLKWNQARPPVEIDVKGVRSLRLEVNGGGRSWLFGSTAWGNPELLE